MANAKVALILGAGPRVGAAVAVHFANDGYKVVLASRRGTGTMTPEGYLSLKVDLSNPTSVPPLFDAIKSEFHAFPNVIIYNAATFTKPPEDASPLSVPVKNLESDLNVNTISAYVAAQQAIEGWKTLPKEAKKTYIYTGNRAIEAIAPMPAMMTLSLGKRASSAWIGHADSAYTTQGYRFFYADERHGDGAIKGMELDGAAHGDFYVKLAQHEGKVPWHATFVKDKGYVSFQN